MLTFMFHLLSTEIINRCIKIISGLNVVKIKTMILWKTLDALLFNRWAWKTSVKGNIRIDDEWTKMWYICAMEYYSVKNEWNNYVLCSNTDVPRDCHTVLSKSDIERQISYGIAYMWNKKKMVQINLSTDRNRVRVIENRLMATTG